MKKIIIYGSMLIVFSVFLLGVSTLALTQVTVNPVVNFTIETQNVTYNQDLMNDSTTSTNLRWESSGAKIIGIDIPKNSTITSAELDVNASSMVAVYAGKNWSLTNAQGITQNGTDIWVIPVNGPVMNYDMEGNEKGNFSLTSGNDKPTGITHNDTFFWIVDFDDDTVYKYWMNGSYTGDSWATTNSATPHGITTDNTNIWISSWFDTPTNYVYKYDMEGTYISQFDTGVSIGGTGMANDETFLYLNQIDTNEVKQYRISDGSSTGSYFFLPISNTFPWGIETNGTNWWTTDRTDGRVSRYLSYVNYTDFYVDVGNDDNIDWNISELNKSASPQTADLNTTEINDFLSTCSSDANGLCELVINISSIPPGTVMQTSTDYDQGKVGVSNINITFDYNVSYLFSVTEFSQYYLINNTDDKISVDLNISGYNVSAGATSCRVNNTIKSTTGSPEYCPSDDNFTVGDQWYDYLISDNIIDPPPIITITHPTNITYYAYATGGSLDLNWTNNEDLLWSGYSLNGAANVTINDNTTITPADGSNNITIWGNDTIMWNLNNSVYVFFTYKNFGTTTTKENVSDSSSYSYSISGLTSEIFNISVKNSDAGSLSEFNVSVINGSSGLGINTSNFTVELSQWVVHSLNNLTNVEVNITPTTTLNATFFGNITFIREDGLSFNVSITATVAPATGNVDFITNTFSAAFVSGVNVGRVISINNSGDFNLSACNASLSSTIGVTGTFNSSNFTVEPSSPLDILMNITGTTVGTDGAAVLTLTCIANVLNGIDTDSITGSISVTAADTGGTGGGGSPGVSICGNGFCERGETEEGCPSDCVTAIPDFTFNVLPTSGVISRFIRQNTTYFETVTILNPNAQNISVSVLITCEDNDPSCEWWFLQDEEGIAVKDLNVNVPAGTSISPGRKELDVVVAIPEDIERLPYRTLINFKAIGQRKVITAELVTFAGTGILSFLFIEIAFGVQLWMVLLVIIVVAVIIILLRRRSNKKLINI